jgi:hypothetical protein
MHIFSQHADAAKVLEKAIVNKSRELMLNGSDASVAPPHYFSEQRSSSSPAWLLQCAIEGNPSSCSTEALHILMLFGFLSISILLVITSFAFFREDKEEQITPLCPQLLVKNTELKMGLPLALDAMDGWTVTDDTGKFVCKIILDWPDPFRQGNQSGTAATIRIMNQFEGTFATVFYRSPQAAGQSIALCRAGCEIFGFVEVEGTERITVRHVKRVGILTLKGDFIEGDVVGVNPVGTEVCSFKRCNDEDVIQCQVLQHVDAGLVLCAFLAGRLQRLLQDRTSSPALGGTAGEMLAQLQQQETPRSD